MRYEDILIAPVLSEKSNDLRESGKYTFKVHPDATKPQIKEAVSKLFDVKVVGCTVLNMRGKVKRLRNRPGRTSGYRKAVVRLAPGDAIKIFEGV